MKPIALLALALAIPLTAACGAASPADGGDADVASEADALVGATTTTRPTTNFSATTSTLDPYLKDPCSAYKVEAVASNEWRRVRDAKTGKLWLFYRYGADSVVYPTHDEATRFCASQGARLGTKAELATILGLNYCLTAWPNWPGTMWSSTTSGADAWRVLGNGEGVLTARTAHIGPADYGSACIY